MMFSVMFILLVVMVKLVAGQESDTLTPTPPFSLLNINDTLSSPWYGISYKNRCSRCCKTDQLPSEMKCIDDEGVQIEYGYCVTFDGQSFQSSTCHYFQPKGHTVTEDGYVILPDNVSELNDYMCRTMNRQGPLCSRCIDGFGPALSSYGFKCSNCTDMWYGVPLYLLVELLPITILYFVILTFQINLTSSPWTAFILFSHIILFEVQYDRRPPLGQLIYQMQGAKLTILEAVYGMINLEIFHFIVPPFCISSKLQFIHVSILEYLPALYPLFLILLTWICIELHGRNFRLLVWAWKPFHKCFVRMRRGWSNKSDLVDVFASFFLLSSGKIMFQSLFFMGCQQKSVFSSGSIYSVSTTFYDPSLPCRETRNIGPTFLGLFLLFLLSILPVLLLCLYPLKIFRTCLSKCKLDGLVITTFVNKFHGCYRDGLDGGRDMRSLSGLYFFLRALSVVIRYMFHILSPNLWISYTLFYLFATLLIAWLKPYKELYMNLLDTIILATITLMSLILSSEYFSAQATELYVLIFIPTGLFALYIIGKIVTNKKLNLKWRLLTLLTGIQGSYRKFCKIFQSNPHGESADTTITDSDLQESVSSTIVTLSQY